ncbi:MAG: hypothetical protein N4Q43_04630, partial [Lactobacillus crispatus]|nr:hypothetical protein [Lactobacillus crispatus]
MKKFDNEKYQILAKDLMGDIFYSETSNRNKIATIRQYAEVIVRKILDIDSSEKVTVGAKKISEKIEELNNSKFLKEALEDIKQDGNQCTHTEYLGDVTSDEFDKIVDKLLDMLSFMLINYFETYEFGSRSDVLRSFSLLPPIVRYKVLIFLYKKYHNNIHVIDKLALAIVKAFDKEEAIRWVEEEKNNLINLDTMSDKVFAEIAKNKGIEIAEFIRFSSPYKNMYELCIDKIMKIGNEIDLKGHLYIDFESALPYYK